MLMGILEGGLTRLHLAYNWLLRNSIPAPKEEISSRFDQFLAVLVLVSERQRVLELKLDKYLASQVDAAADVYQENARRNNGSVLSEKLNMDTVRDPEHFRRDVEEFVIKAYQGVLRRDPDKEGLYNCTRDLVDGVINHSQVITSLMSSYEFDYTPEKDPRLAVFLRPELIKFGDMIRAFTPLSVSAIENLGKQFAGVEYFEVHKRRFVEMINFVAFAASKKSTHIRVLECGSTISTMLLKSALPDISLSISDFKTFDEIEEASLFPMRDFVDKHYQIDFQKDDLSSVFYQGEPLFDVILLCEVIEHVLVNPIKVFRFLLKHLADDGFIYITTPNVFQRSYLEAYRARINPVQIFPEDYKFEDAPHFHVREYSMSEMLQSVSMAGGQVAGFYFSHCWDNPEFFEIIPEHERSNIIVIMKRGSK